MRIKYIIYPEGLRKLTEAGLVGKLEREIQKGKIPSIFHGMVNEDEVGRDIQHLNEVLFCHFPRLERERLLHQINRLYGSWKILNWGLKTKAKTPNPQLDLFLTEDETSKETTHHETEAEDVLLLSGWYASRFLSKKEIVNYRDFGFSSLMEFFGTLGALLVNGAYSDHRQGLIWESTHPDGRVLRNEIAGNFHYDLLISQTDVTPYDTLDPLGNKVHYHPTFDSDKRFIASHHSTEPFLLTGLLKWIEQTGITSEMLKDNAQPLLEWTASLGQRGGGATEHFFGDYDESKSRQDFVLFDETKMDSIDKQREYPGFSIPGGSDGYHYGMFVGRSKELIILAHEKEKGFSQDPAAVYQPEEADHLLKGLFYQAAMGLGRTSARQMMGHLEYRFSERYEQDVEKFKHYTNNSRK